jgi:hypothetical protein
MKIASTELSNLIGAVVAVGDNVLIITLLLARLAGQPRIEHWLGIVLIGSILPLGYLLVSAFGWDSCCSTWESTLNPPPSCPNNGVHVCRPLPVSRG